MQLCYSLFGLCTSTFYAASERRSSWKVIFFLVTRSYLSCNLWRNRMKNIEILIKFIIFPKFEQSDFKFGRPSRGRVPMKIEHLRGSASYNPQYFQTTKSQAFSLPKSCGKFNNWPFPAMMFLFAFLDFDVKHKIAFNKNLRI